MRFDSNKAWTEAVQYVTANRQVLWALAGVFFVLPSFVFAVAFPQPEPTPGMMPEEMMKQLNGYYAGVWPWVLVTLVLQLLGTLTILTLFTDRTRPTVGQAIRQGTAGVGPVLLAQLLAGLVMMLVALLLIGAGAATGVAAMLVVTTILAIVAIVYFTVRTILVSPLVAVEGLRNPLSALARSWRLTKPVAWQMVLFFVLLGIAMGVVIAIVLLVAGLLFAVVLDAESARFVAALISSVLVAGATIYLIGVIAAVHRQLAGPSAEAAAKPFE